MPSTDFEFVPLGARIYFYGVWNCFGKSVEKLYSLIKERSHLAIQPLKPQKSIITLNLVESCDGHLTFSEQLVGVLVVKYKQQVCGIDYLRQSLEWRNKSLPKR